jgi:hypothetical protein
MVFPFCLHRLKSGRLPLGAVGLASGGESDDEHEVVGLNLGLVGGAATADLSALAALGYDDEALFGVGLGGYGLQVAAAGVGAVTGVDVHVAGPQAEGAVISGGVAQGLDLTAAVDAGKSVVQLGKSLLFQFHGRVSPVWDDERYEIQDTSYKIRFVLRVAV